MSKRFLCLKSDGLLEAGKVYEELALKVFGISGLIYGGTIKSVETFIKDGVEWIRHDGGVQPVPDDWVIIAKMKDGLWTPQGQYCASWYTDECWRNSISEFRIISTWEPEAPEVPVEYVHGDNNLIMYLCGMDVCVPSDFADKETPESRMHEWSEVQKRDHRDPSPQEAAYAAKVAAMEPKPEAPKKFPALRDIDYNPCLLGAGQFLKEAE